VPAYSLRNWEKNEILKPQRKNSKQRLYSKADIERIFAVKQLINKRHMSLKGAKKELNDRQKMNRINPELALKEGNPPDNKLLKEIWYDLTKILEILKQ
jgi:DNA-binding transcriptional MerR regulator